MWVGLRLLIQGFEGIDTAVSYLGLGRSLGEGLVVLEREKERVGLTEKCLVGEFQFLIVLRC